MYCNTEYGSGELGCRRKCRLELHCAGTRFPANRKSRQRVIVARLETSKEEGTMQRYYIFLLQGSWRTDDRLASTVEQAYRIAKKVYGYNVIRQYQTCSLNGMVFSGWKQMNGEG